MLEIFSQGWFGSIVGLLGLVVGVIGIVLYRNTKIGPIPTCQLRSLRLLGKEEQELPPEVEIRYKDKEVQRLTLTSVYFWNDGRTMMRGNQIVEDDPLRYEFDPSDEILKAHVATSTKPANKVTARAADNDKHTLLVDFDYLDPGDGVRIDILHTSAHRYPKIEGSLRGIPKGVSRIDPSPASAFDLAFRRILRNPKPLYVVTLFVGITGLVVGALPTLWLEAISGVIISAPAEPVKSPVSGIRFIALFVGATYTLLPALAYLGKRKKYPSALDRDDPKNDEAEPKDAGDKR